MNPSLFLALVQQYFPSLVLKIVEKYNGQNTPLPYYYRQYLRKVFSVDGKWSTISVNNSLVAADLIAMDSEIPLKTRPTMGIYTGDIPKLGMELALNEKELTDLQTLVARLGFNGSASTAQIVAKLFRDTDRVIGGVYERLEMMFLQGLSSGVTVVDDSETVGTGIRLTFNYPTANQFTSSTTWANAGTATPFTDMQKVIDAAVNNGDVITAVLMDRTTLNRIAATNEGKQLYASASGFFGANIPVPTLDQLNTAVRAKYGFEIRIIERSVRLEKNGAKVAINPWKFGSVVFITSDQLGSLTHARLAEMDHPSAGVSHQTADEFMLVSKFVLNRPSLKEVTNVQARVIPVIDAVDQIYILDSTVTTG